MIPARKKQQASCFIKPSSTSFLCKLPPNLCWIWELPKIFPHISSPQPASSSPVSLRVSDQVKSCHVTQMSGRRASVGLPPLWKPQGAGGCWWHLRALYPNNRVICPTQEEWHHRRVFPPPSPHGPPFSLLLFLSQLPLFVLHPCCSIFCWEAGWRKGSGIVFRDQWQFRSE